MGNAGGSGEIRTRDQRIKSPLLYRLSYRPCKAGHYTGSGVSVKDEASIRAAYETKKKRAKVRLSLFQIALAYILIFFLTLAEGLPLPMKLPLLNSAGLIGGDVASTTGTGSTTSATAANG